MERTFKGADQFHFERFICSQTLVMSLEGIPAFYIHSLLATPNDHEQVEHRGMNRAINRHRWDYPTLRGLLDDPASPQARVLDALTGRLKLRGKQTAFHPNATQFTVNMGDDRIFGVWRQSLDRHQSIFALHNISDETVTISSEALNLIEDVAWCDLLSGETVDPLAAQITLTPINAAGSPTVPEAQAMKARYRRNCATKSHCLEPRANYVQTSNSRIAPLRQDFV